MATVERRAEVIEWVRGQALAEPFNGVLLNHLADDIEAGGEGWRPFEALDGVPAPHNVALRVMSAAHRVALQGEAPALARHLPTCGGDGDAEAAWPAFYELCGSGALDHDVLAAVQTNEAARTTTLLPGFGAVATETGLPLRLLEIGSSAGLLLNVDRYHHELSGGQTWGPTDSPVQLLCEGDAPMPAFEIESRRGCDVNPLDAVADRLVLLSFVWPTQLDRFRRLEAALDVATAHPVTVDHASVGLLADQLAEPTPGVATVVFHSVVWQYLGDAEQASITSTLTTAGEAATTAAPVAWLRLEPHEDITRGAELRLTTWPHGDERVLALCDYHGRWIHWGDS